MQMKPDIIHLNQLSEIFVYSLLNYRALKCFKGKKKQKTLTARASPNEFTNEPYIFPKP